MFVASTWISGESILCIPHFFSFYTAVSCEHESVVRLLVRRGADTSIRDSDGNTADQLTDNANIKIVFDTWHVLLTDGLAVKAVAQYIFCKMSVLIHERWFKPLGFSWMGHSHVPYLVISSVMLVLNVMYQYWYVI